MMPSGVRMADQVREGIQTKRNTDADPGVMPCEREDGWAILFRCAQNKVRARAMRETVNFVVSAGNNLL